MTIGTSLRTAARTLIEKFGNSITVYSLDSATKSTNDEGDVSVSNWGAGTSAKCIDGENSKELLSYDSMGIEQVGDDDIIIKDNVTIETKDRITKDSVDYKVVEVSPVVTQDTTVAKIVGITRVTGTTNWV